MERFGGVKNRRSGESVASQNGKIGPRHPTAILEMLSGNPTHRNLIVCGLGFDEVSGHRPVEA